MTVAGPMPLEYLRRVWALRHFWLALVGNDIRHRYRRSLLGVGWSLVRPVAMTAVFCAVFGALFHRDVGEYAPYVLIGMVTWQLLHESLMLGCHSFSQGAAYIRQQQVPHAIFPLRTVLGSGFHFAVALAVGIALAIFCRGVTAWLPLLFLPVAFVMLLLLCWSLAIVAGVTATHFPDASHLLEIALQILFYLTPIMYDPADLPQRSGLTEVVGYNPIYAMLEWIRAPLLRGELPAVQSIAIGVGFTAATGLLAWILMRRLEKTLVFWL